MTTIAYSPWGNGPSAQPFDALYDNVVDGRKHGLKNVDAFLLWGGTDIHPSFYGSKAHYSSQAPTVPSERDLWEWQAMKYCKANNIPIIGVCRGAQFLCAFAGGKLIQHCSGHMNGEHEIITQDGQLLWATSSHHQMLDVSGTNHEMLAWCPEPLSGFYFGESSETPAHLQKDIANGLFVEPEIVFFPDVKGLAIQGHPEWDFPDSLYVKYCLEMVTENLHNVVWSV